MFTKSMFTKSTGWRALVGLVVVLFFSASAWATEIISDSFLSGASPAAGEYSVGDLVPQNPTVGTFNSAWANGLTSTVPGAIDAVATGLFWPSHPVDGGAVSFGNPTSIVTTESVVRGDFANPEEPLGKSIYISGLMSFDAGFNTATTSSAFTGLLNAEEGDPSVPLTIGLQWGFVGNGVGGVDAVIRARNTTGTVANYQVGAGISPGTHLFVARVDVEYMYPADSRDRVSVWLDPVANVLEQDAGAPALVSDTGNWLTHTASPTNRVVDTLVFDATDVGAGSAVMFDEVRMGETWRDVLPNAPVLLRPGSPIVLQEGFSNYRYEGNHVRGGAATTNYDYVESIVGALSGTAPLRGLMAFGLDEIPPLSTIDDVTLELTIKRTDIRGVGFGDIGLYLTDPSITETMVEEQATWNLINTGNPWPTGGGDPTTLLSSIPEFGNEAVGTVKTFASTAALVAAAQAALDGGSTLNMVVMAPDAEALNQRNFMGYYSDNEALLGKRPKLTIAFTLIPEPSTIGLLLAALASLAAVRFRRRK